MTDQRQRVLHIEQSTFQTEDHGGIGSLALDLEIFSADFMLLRTESPGRGSAFGDVCCGLIAPSAGAVRFLGRDWQELLPDMANALRGRIGRLHARGRWINQLGMLENILLQQMHHTRNDAQVLYNEVSRLAVRLGLPGAPMGLPGAYSAEERQRAGCIRACVGSPALILLEEPTAGLAGKSSARLINVLGRQRNQGAAVVWITGQNRIWQDATIPANRRFRWIGREFIEVGKQP